MFSRITHTHYIYVYVLHVFVFRIVCDKNISNRYILKSAQQPNMKLSSHGWNSSDLVYGNLFNNSTTLLE